MSAAALPLPSGAAKDSTLTDGSARIGGTVGVSGPLTDTQLRASRVPVDGSGVTQPVSGTFFQATQPVSAASLPLPAGAAKDSTLTDSTQRVGGTVAVTQSTTPWKSREDTAAMTRVSAKNAAPSASAVQADTGQLAAGDYDFDIQLLASDTTAVGKGLVVEHRNAANNATLQTLGGAAAPGQIEIHLRRYTMATNERIRVIAGTAAGATSSMYVSAIGSRVS